MTLKLRKEVNKKTMTKRGFTNLQRESISRERVEILTQTYNNLPHQHLVTLANRYKKAETDYHRISGKYAFTFPNVFESVFLSSY